MRGIENAAADEDSQWRYRMLRYVGPEEIPPDHDILSAAELDRQLGNATLTLIASGDMMLGGRAKAAIRRNPPDYTFAAVQPLLQRAPIVMGNLEGPIAAEARRSTRRFSYRVDPAVLTEMRAAGVNVVTLANNHLLDCGREGVIETLEELARGGMDSVGAGMNKRLAHRPAIRFADDLRIGMLGYYWNRRTAATNKLAGSAIDTRGALRADIEQLRRRADRIVVMFHWGVPYQREVSAEDRAKARFAIDCGADLVVGHHPHVIQPFELRAGRPIFYSVGNFAFGSGNSKAEGMLLGAKFEASRATFELYPLYVRNRDPRVNYQPKVLGGPSARRLLARVATASGANGQYLRIEDNRGIIQLRHSPSQGAGGAVDG
jgi:poly-gamma-glutamate capsule biosynthesis protein CapA/YwtB (metallophosphatase superfamily)